MRQTASSYIALKKSQIHSTGVFAKKAIPEGTRIIEYVGKRLEQ